MTTVVEILEELRAEHVRLYGTTRKWRRRVAYAIGVSPYTINGWWNPSTRCMPSPEKIIAIMVLLKLWKQIKYLKSNE